MLKTTKVISSHAESGNQITSTHKNVGEKKIKRELKSTKELKLRVLSLKKIQEISELEATSNPREISQDSSNGLNTSEFKDRRES